MRSLMIALRVARGHCVSLAFRAHSSTGNTTISKASDVVDVLQNQTIAMLVAARRAVAPIERSVSAAISTSASSGAAAVIPTGHPGPDAHPWLDYKHPGQPGARNDYRDADKDFGFHLSGALFERPHLRRYTDYFQGDGKVSMPPEVHHCFAQQHPPAAVRRRWQPAAQGTGCACFPCPQCCCFQHARRD